MPTNATATPALQNPGQLLPPSAPVIDIAAIVAVLLQNLPISDAPSKEKVCETLWKWGAVYMLVGVLLSFVAQVAFGPPYGFAVMVLALITFWLLSRQTGSFLIPSTLLSRTILGIGGSIASGIVIAGSSGASGVVRAGLSKLVGSTVAGDGNTEIRWGECDFRMVCLGVALFLVTVHMAQKTNR